MGTPGSGWLRVEGERGFPMGLGTWSRCSGLPALLAPRPCQTPAKASHRLLRSVPACLLSFLHNCCSVQVPRASH